MKIRKAVIPAAGLGTRFLPATKVVPKELLPIVDRPALEYIVEELAQSGIEEIILVLNDQKKQILSHFSPGGSKGHQGRLSKLNNLIEKVRFRTVEQREALGLGHAVLCAKEAVGDEPFIVALPDDLVRSETPCTAQLIEQYKKAKTSTIAVEEVSKDAVSSYGIVAGKEMRGRSSFKVDQIVEKPKKDEAPSSWAIIGRYLLHPTIFRALEEVKPGALGELQLTDGLAKLARTNDLTAYPFEGKRIDAGQPLGFLQANLTYAFDSPELKKGLTPILRQLLKDA